MRLKRGEYLAMTPEQKREHRLAMAKKYRDAHREELYEKNKKYFDMYKRDKPFLCTCNRCQSLFCAARKNTRVCPNCHKLERLHWEEIKLERQRQKLAKEVLKEQVLDLRRRGMLQKDIGEQLGITQRTVCNILLRNDIRSLSKHKRETKSIDLFNNIQYN